MKKLLLLLLCVPLIGFGQELDYETLLKIIYRNKFQEEDQEFRIAHQGMYYQQTIQTSVASDRLLVGHRLEFCCIIVDGPPSHHVTKKHTKIFPTLQ